MTEADSDGCERWLMLLKLPCPPTTVPVVAAWACGPKAIISPPVRAATRVARNAFLRADMRDLCMGGSLVVLKTC